MVEAAEKSFLHLIFVRHGERSDFVSSNEDTETKPPDYYDNRVDVDPNLTLMGIRQATEAGQHFKSCIEETQA